MPEPITLAPLKPEDIPVIAQVARLIWQEHYVPLVGAAQVEFMLRTRYDEADLLPDIGASDRWLEVLRLGETVIGFVRCWLLPGDTLQLKELYLVAEARGQGHAARLMDRAEELARASGRTRLVLWVYAATSGRCGRTGASGSRSARRRISTSAASCCATTLWKSDFERTTMQFRTTIELAGKTATGFAVPEEIVQALGSHKRPPVRVTIGGHTYRSTVAVMCGRYLLPLSAENRTAAGVTAGDEVEVEIERDDAPREVTVPADFAELLDREPAVRQRFDALSYSHRREHVAAIEGAKTPETRQRRIEKALAMLR